MNIGKKIFFCASQWFCYSLNFEISNNFTFFLIIKKGKCSNNAVITL